MTGAKQEGGSPPRLYDYWRSSASYRVRIALGLKGLSFETVPIDLAAGRQRTADHLKRNPQGFVPVLEIDGLRLIQSVAILEYLEETRPDPALLPDDPAARAEVRALAHAVAMDIHPVCNLHVANHVVALTEGGEDARKAWMQRFIGLGLDAFEGLLDQPGRGAFCHGESPGLADCCLIPQLYNARRWGLDVTRWPRIAAVEAACSAIESIVAAHPDQFKPD